MKECKSYLERTKPSNLLEALLIAWASPKVEQGVDGVFSSLVSSVDTAIYQLDDSTYYKDVDVQRNIRNMIFSLESFLTTISDSLSLPLTGISQIAELISMKIMGLNESWATATCYLSAMEIVINKKREELRLEEEKDFNARFRGLLKVLENKGTKVSELEKELPSVFWRLRNQVIHSGYSPTQDELDLIITWVKRVIKFIAG